MTRWTRTLCLVALLPACADSCSCGQRADSSVAPKTAPAPVKAPSDGPVLGVNEEHYTDEAEKLRGKLTPMPDSEQRKALEAAANAIDVTKDQGDPIDAKRLAAVLPKSIDDYEPVGPARIGTTPAELGTATVAARQYKDGKALINLKITDTADAPALRRDLAAQLTGVGNEPTGSQTGVLEDDVPGVRAYHEANNASRASALIGGRFLVEVMVDNAIEQDDAWTAIEEIERDELERTAAAAVAASAKK